MPLAESLGRAVIAVRAVAILLRLLRNYFILLLGIFCFYILECTAFGGGSSTSTCRAV